MITTTMMTLQTSASVPSKRKIGGYGSGVNSIRIRLPRTANGGNKMTNNAINIQNLYKRYDVADKSTALSRAGQQKEDTFPYVLQDVNLSIPKGEFHILLGKSGCGKSSLLNIVAGFLKKTSGSVQVNNSEVIKPGPDRGVVFQNADAAIFPWLNVWRNVEYGMRMQKVDRDRRQQVVKDCLKIVGLNGHEKKYPGELSGGMKQRVQIARSIANNSEILIMDEPFGALDAQSRAVMQNELINIWKSTGKTILFVTHDIQEAILLGQKISLFTKAPNASIRETILVDLPYRRNFSDPRARSIEKAILSYFDTDEYFMI